MSQYLRDEFLKNLNFSEEALRKINEDIMEIATQANQSLRNQYKDQDLTNRLLIPSYIIRFDGRGFRLFEFEKIMRCFQDAKRVERFIFILDAINSLNRITGKSIDLKFDALESNNCQLIVQDDDGNWVDAVFCKLKERLSRHENNNHIIQNRFVPFIVQILGVLVGFVISLWIAIKISPRLAIDNSLAFSFVIAFLLFSNVWTLLYEGIIRGLNYFWPNLSFKEKVGFHWLIKAVISSAFVGISFFIASKLFSYLAGMLKSIIK